MLKTNYISRIRHFDRSREQHCHASDNEDPAYNFEIFLELITKILSLTVPCPISQKNNVQFLSSRRNK